MHQSNVPWFDFCDRVEIFQAFDTKEKILKLMTFCRMDHDRHGSGKTKAVETQVREKLCEKI